MFAEMAERRPGETVMDTAHLLWYGEYDGRRWTPLLPLPTQGRAVFPNAASAIARDSGGLVWVLPTGGPAPGLLVLKRRNTGWLSEIVPTPTPKAEILVGATGESMLAMIQGDSTLSSDENSLLLRAGPTWGVVEVLRAGATEPVYRLESSSFDRHRVVTWHTGSHSGNASIRALVVAPNGARSVVTVDSAADAMSPLRALDIPNVGIVWIVTRTGPLGSEIHFRHLSPSGDVRVLGALRNPFVGLYRPVLRGSNVVLVGPITKGREYAATYLLEVSVQCNARS